MAAVYACLIAGYLCIMIWENREKEKRYLMGRLCAGVIIFGIAALFPYLVHFSYYALAVWYSPSILAAVVMISATALLYVGVQFMKLKKKHYREENYEHKRKTKLENEI